MTWKELLNNKERSYDSLKEKLKVLESADINKEEKTIEKIKLEYEMKRVAEDINKIEKHLKRLDYVKKVRVK